MTRPLRQNLLVVLAGPTAVGKTATAVWLAQQLETEVINADSRQVYKSLRIGTGRPTEAELQGVPHHLLGHVPVESAYSAGRFEREALAKLENIFRSHNVAIAVGGTGLYLKALCYGIQAIPASAEVREQLQQELTEKGLAPLVTELQAADPAYATTVDLHNPQRVLRALEVCRLTGNTYSSYRTGEVAERPFDVLYLVLHLPREQLYERINQRVWQMHEDGLEQEAKAHYEQRHLAALQTLGYSEWFAHWQGELTREQVVPLIQQNTRRYAKRQLTWFRREAQAEWFLPTQKEEILERVQERMQQASAQAH